MGLWYQNSQVQHNYKTKSVIGHGPEPVSTTPHLQNLPPKHPPS
jgi:hypothetical protein